MPKLETDDPRNEWYFFHAEGSEEPDGILVPVCRSAGPSFAQMALTMTQHVTRTQGKPCLWVQVAVLRPVGQTVLDGSRTKPKRRRARGGAIP